MKLTKQITELSEQLDIIVVEYCEYLFGEIRRVQLQDHVMVTIHLQSELQPIQPNRRPHYQWLDKHFARPDNLYLSRGLENGLEMGFLFPVLHIVSINLL